MCNYELLAIDEGVSDADVLAQADIAIERLGGDLSKFPYLLLTSQGSFLDDHEVGRELRSQLLRKFWAAGLRAISTESEARYCLDATRLREMLAAFPGRISIGIGLEAANDFIRNSIINKGLPSHMFVEATDIIRDEGLHFYTYITLGKPFLSPSEDVADAVAAVRFSAEHGAFMSVIEMINVQPHTLTERLWRDGTYIPCSLWRGVALLRGLRADDRDLVSIKGFDADISPVPLAVPRSCEACDSTLRAAFNHWNFHRDYAAFEGKVTACSCEEPHSPSYEIPIESRVREAVEALAVAQGAE